MINLKTLIVNGIVRLTTMIYGKDAEVKGTLQCGGLKITTNENSTLRPFYLEDGEIKTCEKAVIDAGNYASGEEPTSGSYIGNEVTSQAGTRSVINIANGINIATTSSRYVSSGNRMDLWLKNPEVSGSDTVLLTDNNWSQYIDVNDDIEAGDGQVSITYNGASLGSFTMNQNTNTTINIPSLVKYPSARMTSSWMSSFRTQTKGDANSGSYISVQRTDTGGITGLPQYGSYLAGGVYDTQFFISTNYYNREVNFAGGNADAIRWRQRIAFKEDIPDVSGLMKTNASNCTTAAIHNLATKGTLAWDDTAIIDAQTIYANGARYTMQALWECMRGWRPCIFQSDNGYLSKASLTNLWYQNEPYIYNRYWNVIESTTTANKDKVTDAIYHGNIQYAMPYIDFDQFRAQMTYALNNGTKRYCVRIDLQSPTQNSVFTSDTLNFIIVKPYFLNATEALVKNTNIILTIPPNSRWFVFIDENNITDAAVTGIETNNTSQPILYGISMDPDKGVVYDYF